MHMYALDVLDWKRGMDKRLEYEMNLLYTAAEIAAGTKVYKPKRKEKTRYSDKVRDLIDKADALDRQLGKIK